MPIPDLMGALADFGKPWGIGEDAAERAKRKAIEDAMRRDSREMLVRTGYYPSLDLPGADLTQEQIEDYGGRWGIDEMGDPSPVDQQITAIEDQFGPLTDESREWIAGNLRSGRMTVGRAIEQLKVARADWRP